MRRMEDPLQEHYMLCIQPEIWDKVCKVGPSKICGRYPLKNVTLSTLEYFVPLLLLVCFITYTYPSTIHVSIVDALKSTNWKALKKIRRQERGR